MTSCNQVVAQSVATPGGTVQNDNKSRVISSPNIIIDNAGVYIPQLNGIKISIQKTPMTASTGVIVQPAAQAANNTRMCILSYYVLLLLFFFYSK